jgi:hypothetical protein
VKVAPAGGMCDSFHKCAAGREDAPRKPHKGKAFVAQA